jgi:hypothetical protein
VPTVPTDHPVQPVRAPHWSDRDHGLTQCGSCGRYWDDSVPTSLTPVPSGRCPFEYFHGGPVPADDATREMLAGQDAVRQANAETLRKITRYVNGFRFPSADPEEVWESIPGDCFICQCGGDSYGDHLTSHLAEKYYVTSLILNAVREAGYRPDMAGWIALDRGSDRPSVTARRALRKYLKRRLMDGAVEGNKPAGSERATGFAVAGR